jgi:hypothetical protein
VSPESGVHVTVNGFPDFGEAVVVWRFETAAVACENARRATLDKHRIHFPDHVLVVAYTHQNLVKDDILYGGR